MGVTVASLEPPSAVIAPVPKAAAETTDRGIQNEVDPAAVDDQVLGDLVLGDAAEPCAERPWRGCGAIEELPVAVAADPQPAEVAQAPVVGDLVDHLVDQMVRDTKAAATPQSLFTVRTVGYAVPKGSIIILTSERHLLYFFQESIALEFSIGVARHGLQRLGQTQIVEKRRQPTWVPTALQHRVYRNLPGSVGPGPNNPLGSRALNLTIPNIRIHGTNDDKTIGAALSDGCFHMHNRDIEYLYEIVSVGTKVTILR